MPKMVRWEKQDENHVPVFMREEAVAIYKDTETGFYLSMYDKSARSNIEQIWKVTNKNGDILKGMYTCCGFRLKFPPIKWACKIADNKFETATENGELPDYQEGGIDYSTPKINTNDEDDENEENTEVNETSKYVKSSISSIVEAVQEEVQQPSVQSEQPTRRRGRPPGSKSKPKVLSSNGKRRGRPPGSKNKSK